MVLIYNNTNGVETDNIRQKRFDSITEAVGQRLKNIKSGVLSCVESISNSLEIMRRTVQSGMTYIATTLRGLMMDKAKEQDKKPVKLCDIQPAAAKEFSQSVIGQMGKNPDYLDGMFRECIESKKIPIINQCITHPGMFTKAIANHDISATSAGVCVKQWIGASVGENKFSMKDVDDIIRYKDDPQFVQSLVYNKFLLDDDYDIFCSLISVAQKYKMVCDEQKSSNESSYNYTGLTNAGLPVQMFKSEVFLGQREKCNNALFIIMQHCSR